MAKSATCASHATSDCTPVQAHASACSRTSSAFDQPEPFVRQRASEHLPGLRIYGPSWPTALATPVLVIGVQNLGRRACSSISNGVLREPLEYRVHVLTV